MVNYTFIIRILLTEMFKRVGLVYTEEYCTQELWYLTKSWTEEEQKDFKLWGEKILKTKLKMSSYQANKEMGWFLLSYGWTTRSDNENKD